MVCCEMMIGCFILVSCCFIRCLGCAGDSRFPRYHTVDGRVRMFEDSQILVALFPGIGQSKWGYKTIYLCPLKYHLGCVLKDILVGPTWSLGKNLENVDRRRR